MASKIDQDRIPKRMLRGGERISCLGLGTFGSDKYGPEEIAEAVYGAVKYGYRLIDCASVYQNEDRIGQVLDRLFGEEAVERKELFITSKVWNDMHGAGQVLESCKKSLADLRLEYLDLYFVHWPFPNYHAPGCTGDSRNPDSRPFSVEAFMATWRQCEELVDKGLVRYIGMSNMTIPKLEAVLPLCRIQPAALEMELHPSFQQPELFLPGLFVFSFQGFYDCIRLSRNACKLDASQDRFLQHPTAETQVFAVRYDLFERHQGVGIARFAHFVGPGDQLVLFFLFHLFKIALFDGPVAADRIFVGIRGACIFAGILNPDSRVFQHLVQHDFLAQVADVDADRVVDVTAFRHFPGCVVLICTARKSHHHGIVVFLYAFQ